MFTDEVNGIDGFTVAGVDSEIIPTVCVVIAEDVVTGEEAIVEEPIVDVFVTCGIEGIVDVD
jgi:hypothetical protein